MLVEMKFSILKEPIYKLVTTPIPNGVIKEWEMLGLMDKIKYNDQNVREWNKFSKFA